MLPISKLPIDISGLTDDERAELEARIVDFEQTHEASVKEGGPGYVPIIKRGDFIFAGVINVIIVIYMIVAVLIM